VIADDEPIARRLLRELLEHRGDVEISAEAGTGAEAVDAIRRERPSLVFLDIQMPGLDGFEVLDAVGDVPIPAVVIVTAFDRYAVRAFDAEALDYLLKPFDADRLDRAVDRALARIAAADAGAVGRSIAALLTLVRGQRGAAAARRLPITVDDRTRFVEPSSIVWLEADGKHARIHTDREAIGVRRTLAAVAAELDPGEFIRVRRSAVVRVGAIVEVQPWFHGEYVLLLRNGARVTSGRAYRDAVRRLVAGNPPGRTER
jgi:two-component system LytT family response regulator